MTSDDKQEGPGNTSRIKIEQRRARLKEIIRDNVDVRTRTYTHRSELLLDRTIDVETTPWNSMKIIKANDLFKNGNRFDLY